MALTGQRTPFIGRAAERAQLEEVLATTRNDAGAVVAITGEAGIGKSRLLADVLAAPASDLDVLAGQCFEADRGLPYAPLLDLLRDGGEGTAQLRALFESDGEAEQRRRTLYYAIDDLFARRTAKRPVALVLEDLHWCDEATLDFLAWFSTRLSERPLLLLLTWRNDEVSGELSRLAGTLGRQRLLTEIRLGPLDGPEAEQMIRSVLNGLGRVRADVVERVSQLTDGNPFFIEEVLGSAPLEALRSPELLGVPRTVRDAVQRRVDQLSERARRVLLLAAVTGREFDFHLLRTLTSMTEDETLACIRELVQRDLIRERSAERFAFRHALGREAVLAPLLARERRVLHLRVAQALEADTDGGVQPGDLGSHWFTASEWERALPHLLEAGRRALALHAPFAALTYLDRAIDATHFLGEKPMAAVYLDRAHAFDHLGDFDGARADYEQARTLAAEEGDAEVEWQSTIDLGLLWTSRDYDRAGDLFQHALALARDSGDQRRAAHSLNRLGNWHGNVEQPDLAVVMHREALDILERHDDALAVGRTLDLLGTALYMQGDLPGAVDAFERAIPLLEAESDLATLSSALSMRINSGTDYTQTAVASGLGVSAVHDLATRARAIARETGQPSTETFALLESAQALSLFGELGTARDQATEALGIARSLGHSQWICGARQTLGMVYLELLDPIRAREELEQSLRLARELNSTVWESAGRRSLVLACLAGGDLPAARDIVDAALDRGPGTTNLSDRMVWYAAAQLALAEDRPIDALDVADRLIASAANMGDGVVIPALWRLRASALAALGRANDARMVLLEAIAAAEARGLRPLLWRGRLALADLARNAGDRSETEASLDAARDVLRDIATTLEPVERDRFLARAREAIPGGLDRVPGAAARNHHLTAREVEVLRLAAAGMSNAEIAQQLVLSDRTVGNHLASIYGKLGASGRSARSVAVAYAVEHGLAGRPPNSA